MANETVEQKNSEKIQKKVLINLHTALTQIDISKANIKTAYWLSKNARILNKTASEFDALRNEITSTEIFKEYQKELMGIVVVNDSKEEAIRVEKAKNELNEKYKEVLEGGQNELNAFAEIEVEIPEYYKIKLDNIDGINPEYIPLLYDMIDAE